MNGTCDAVITNGKSRSCKNGFPLTGACLGAAGVPVCCNEELCGRLYGEHGGKPALHSTEGERK